MTVFFYKDAGTVASVDISKIAGSKLYEGVNEQFANKLGEDFGIMLELNYNNDSFFLDCTGDLNAKDYSYAVGVIAQVCDEAAELSEYKTDLMSALKSDPRYKH